MKLDWERKGGRPMLWRATNYAIHHVPALSVDKPYRAYWLPAALMKQWYMGEFATDVAAKEFCEGHAGVTQRRRATVGITQPGGLP